VLDHNLGVGSYNKLGDWKVNVLLGSQKKKYKSLGSYSWKTALRLEVNVLWAFKYISWLCLEIESKNAFVQSQVGLLGDWWACSGPSYRWACLTGYTDLEKENQPWASPKCENLFGVPQQSQAWSVCDLCLLWQRECGLLADG
jgi:hypothetical protein